MPIVAADLVAFASINVAGDPPGPTDDVTTAGGAIDEDYRVNFTDLAADDDVEVVSDNAGDTTQDVTLIGRNAAGASVTETVTLNGTTAVIFSTIGVIRSIQSVSMDGDAVGIVTVRRSVGGATIAAIPVGERGFIRLFRNSASEAGAVQRFEKFFFKNTHPTLALQDAEIREITDAAGVIAFQLEDAVDDSNSVANRKTAPVAGDLSGGGVFDSANKLLSTIDAGTADLVAGAAIGIWVEQSLIADNAPIEEAWTVELRGNTAA